LPTDEQIRKLCLRVTIAEAHEEFNSSLVELRIAMRDYFTDLENKGIKMLLEMPNRRAAERGDEETDDPILTGSEG
jgi:hypothetical protein